MSNELFEAMQAAADAYKAMDPKPRHLIAREDVPRGRVFRYYDTEGFLVAYVNLADIETLPKVKQSPSLVPSSMSMQITGIPIRVEVPSEGHATIPTAAAPGYPCADAEER